MTKQDILNEVVNGNWQPSFVFTDSIDEAVDSINKPHEDYFLGLNSKVKEIIQGEIIQAEYIQASIESQGSYFPSNYQITFANVCNWQKELFKHKQQLISEQYTKAHYTNDTVLEIKLRDLPNQHIDLGLRTTNVKVGDFVPPYPMFLEDLKEMCFPIYIEENNFFVSDNWKQGVYPSLTEWYKTFGVIHYLEDLNGRLGGIIINILSYILTGKYLKHEEINRV